jgi:hypothetical protein
MKTRQQIMAAFVCAIWLFGIIHFSVEMMAFDSTPGARAAAPAQWPAKSALLPAAGRTVLLMFVHPECNCSNASLEQLALLENMLDGQLRAYVVLWHGRGMAASGKRREWLRVAPVIDDLDGREAKLFGAKTSGQTMIYNEQGRLIFSGGLTVLRGEGGGEKILQGVVRAIKESGHSAVERPAFGCSILRQAQAEDFGGTLAAWTNKWSTLLR